ncbi:GNAT family N-acetyltransferase [Parasphingorhabdus pacifica]
MRETSVPRSRELVRGLQEKAAGALPAEHVEQMGGWWLRHSTSCAWWTGTVLPHAEAEPAELVHRVIRAEEFYAGHGTNTRFQISRGACPAALDTLLAGRGYRRESAVSLRMGATRRVLEGAPETSLRVRLDDRPTSSWLEVWHAVQGATCDPGTEWDLLARVRRPSAYASAMLGNDVVGVGRCVADGDWAGVFGMATLPHARGERAGRAVLTTLAEWAAARDVDHLYLQVERDNVPALRLYERTGFGEVCEYHYRTSI